MIRVLTLSTLFPDASRPNFGRFVELQTLGLAAHPDIDLRIVAPVGLPPFPLSRIAQYRALTRLLRHEEWRGVPLYRPRFLNIPATHGRWHVARLIASLTPLLDRLYREWPFDVIDAEFFFPDGPAAVALGKRYGVPVSIKARGADIHFWGAQPATAAQVREAGRRANGLLAVSEAMADDMAGIGISRELIRVHRTGIDRARFGTQQRVAAKAALGIDRPLVLSVGALIERKGHALLIDAMADLPGVELRIAGDGPLRGALADQIARLGLSKRVSLLGAVPHDALPPLFAAADVMALPSSSEGLANVWVEALASGTPIVIPDAGGAREVIDRPAAGRIVARTPAAFAAAIAELIADPPDADAVKAAAEPFSWQRNRDTLVAHLAALVESWRQSRG